MTKYSVIIPVYNAEKTLHRCLDSLLAEMYPYAELVLVNDGSTDDSGEICRSYAEAHSNIRYIEKENGGVSTARNCGLGHAQGEYILFVDSDDFVTADFFAVMDAAVESTPADLIRFSYSFDNGQEKRDRTFSPLYVDDRTGLMPHIIDAICRKTINGPVAKLYRRSIIEENSIHFPVGASVAEDRVFNIHYSMFIQSYAVSDRIVYIVSTENDNSLSRKRHDDLKQQFQITDEYFRQALQIAPIPEEEKKQYQSAYNFGSCRSIYHDAKLLHQDHVGWAVRQKRLWTLCGEINRKKMQYPKTRYCTLITLPVRLRLTPVIDAIAWKLTR